MGGGGGGRPMSPPAAPGRPSGARCLLSGSPPAACDSLVEARGARVCSGPSPALLIGRSNERSGEWSMAAAGRLSRGFRPLARSSFSLLLELLHIADPASDSQGSGIAVC